MGDFFKRMRRWRDETISRGQLARFDNRMLADIGMVRGDIDWIVRFLKR